MYLYDKFDDILNECAKRFKPTDLTLPYSNSSEYKMIDDEEETQWKDDGTKWIVTIIPKRHGTLSLSIRDNVNENLYHSILEYKL